MKLVTVLLLAAASCFATTYTVKAAGGGDYTTISACASAAVAGDVCDVYVGSYAGWTQATSGSAGLLITFQEHAGETATITSTVTISSRSYVSITGFAFASGVGITGNGTTNHCRIEYNTFIDARINNAANLATASDNRIRYNVWNNTPNTTDKTAGIVWRGDRNLIEYNEFAYGAGDCMALGGQNVVVRHNTCHSKNGREDFWGGSVEHIDFVQVVGGTQPTLSFSLVENNVMRDCTNDLGNCHFAQVRAGTGGDGEVADTIIWRYNFETTIDGAWGGCGNNGDGTSTTPNCTHYNNTIATGQLVSANGQCVVFDAGPGYTRNNICYDTTTGSTSYSPMYYNYGGDGSGNIVFTNSYSGSWGSPYSTETTYATLRNVDPLFSNYPTSATLQSSSPAIDAGVPLTTVAAADTGTGTSLVLTNSRFFQAGWGPDDAPVGADWIRIGASTTVQISSINYGTNTATLANSVSRSDGDPVYLYKDSSDTQVLYGTLPDIGSFEYTGSSSPSPRQGGATSMSGRMGL